MAGLNSVFVTFAIQRYDLLAMDAIQYCLENDQVSVFNATA